MIIAVFGLYSLVLPVLPVRHIIQGASLFENRGLSENGFSVALTIMPVIITITGIAKTLADKHKKGE